LCEPWSKADISDLYELNKARPDDRRGRTLSLCRHEEGVRGKLKELETMRPGKRNVSR